MSKLTRSNSHSSQWAAKKDRAFKRVSWPYLLPALPLILSQGQEAWAQAPDAGAQQQQLQRELDQNRRELKLPNVSPKSATPRLPIADEQAIMVKGFKVTGNTLVSEGSIQQALTAFNNQSLTFSQIKDAAAAVTALYAPLGRTAQAVIPEQDVVDGIVLIQIIEGRVGKVMIDLNASSPSRLDKDVIEDFIHSHNAQGEFIDLFGLDRSLGLLNELPGNRVAGELAPGEENGTTDIHVKAEDLGWVDGHIDLSNYGSASTGEAQLTSSLNFNNSLGLGDLGSIDLIGAQGSMYGQGRYGIPIGSDGLRASLGFSALDYKTLSDFSSTISQGKAQTYGMYADYALERNADSSKNISLTLEKKNYDNLTSGIEVSQYQINRMSVGVNGVNQFPDVYLNWGVSLSGGRLSINNASQLSSDMSGANTQGEFYKLNINGSATIPLTWIDDETHIQLSGNGQWASKNLNSAEQVYLGGVYGVRAYPTNQGGGSQGANATLTLNHQFIPELQLGVFFDAGLIQQYKITYTNWQGLTNADNIYSLYATGLTGQFKLDQFQLQASIAYRIGNNPLYNSNGLELNSDNYYRRYQGWLKASYFF